MIRGSRGEPLHCLPIVLLDFRCKKGAVSLSEKDSE